MILSIFFVCTYNIDFYFLSCALLLIKYTKSSHTANVNKTHLKNMGYKIKFHALLFRFGPTGILENRTISQE
ncbi:hypothetical protein, partial [Parabacteroides hominis]|uniref:hypothetical protein n=1 Tax=Parabacteroides hominis TaxID=2763057 RepID=UPI001C9B3049